MAETTDIKTPQPVDHPTGASPKSIEDHDSDVDFSQSRDLDLKIKNG